jgi:hypothetical protein
MNKDAIYAWEYMIETLRWCKDDARKDAAYTRLVIDLMNAYPEELELVLDLKTEGGFTDDTR